MDHTTLTQTKGLSFITSSLAKQHRSRWLVLQALGITFFKLWPTTLIPLVTLVFPLAIETKSRTDDQQWLTYWVLYSLITLFEITFAKVLECFPIWAYAKLIVTCWLVLPQFNGAAYVYRRFIRPFYMNPQIITNGQQIWYFPRSKDKKNIFSKPDDVLTAADKYMEEHGTEAFERLITKTDREARARRPEQQLHDLRR